jgi:hypothetical protein
MGRTLLCAALLIAAASFTSSAEASPRSPGVNHRQHRQAARIHHGVRSGELTRAEAHRLRHLQRNVRRDERRAKHDGELSLRERARLHRDLNRSSRAIYRLKQNDRDR